MHVYYVAQGNKETGTPTRENTPILLRQDASYTLYSHGHLMLIAIINEELSVDNLHHMFLKSR